MADAADLAASKHISLNSAALKIAKTFNGSAALLKQYGLMTLPTVDQATKKLASSTNQAQEADAKLADAKLHLKEVQDSFAAGTKLTALDQDKLTAAEAEVAAASDKAATAHQLVTNAQVQMKLATGSTKTVIAELADKLHGQAADAADTFSGRLKAVTTVIEDQVAEFGAKYGPTLTAAGSSLAVLGQAYKLGSSLLEGFRTAQEAATVATEAGTVAEDAATVSEGAMLAPILLITAAAAALGIGIYELVTHWSDVWGAMKTAVTDVWDWIKANWPLIVDIIMGPIGIIGTQIYQHWSDITATIKAAIGLIKGLFTGIGTASPPGFPAIEATVSASIWGNIKTAVVNAIARLRRPVQRAVGRRHQRPACGQRQTVTSVWTNIKNDVRPRSTPSRASLAACGTASPAGCTRPVRPSRAPGAAFRARCPELRTRSSRPPPGCGPTPARACLRP